MNIYLLLLEASDRLSCNRIRTTHGNRAEQREKHRISFFVTIREAREQTRSPFAGRVLERVERAGGHWRLKRTVDRERHTVDCCSKFPFSLFPFSLWLSDVSRAGRVSEDFLFSESELRYLPITVDSRDPV